VALKGLVECRIDNIKANYPRLECRCCDYLPLCVLVYNSTYSVM
jgi:hypothetical protein